MGVVYPQNDTDIGIVYMDYIESSRMKGFWLYIVDGNLIQ